jgi:KaiC/GvpD/RAD55 family RecA-like ATPase
MDKWYVEVEPVSANNTVKSGAMVVYVACNESREEVARVAFIRAHSRNSKTSFPKQLDKEIKKAEKSAQTLNTQGKKAGALS